MGQQLKRRRDNDELVLQQACHNEHAANMALCAAKKRHEQAVTEREAAAAAAERRWDLSWPEEAVMAAIGVGSLLAVRGIHLGVPLLFASGIAACCTFLAWKSWRIVRDRDVSFHGARLRFRGRVGASGWAWLACSALALGGVAYVGALNAVTWLADREDAQVTLPAEAIFNENAQEPEPAMRAAAERALALYALASPPPDGWSVLPFGWRQVALRRAYLLCA
ncbi:MAG: hypothetical protein ACO32I_08320, partial [Candidatus Limnocylindrus sp.]